MMTVSPVDKPPAGRRRSAKPVTVVLAGSGAAALLGAVAFIYSGIFNVGAAWPDDPVTYWVLHKVYTRSLAAHSASVVVPVDYITPAAVAAGAHLYDANCTACHGVPGQALSAIGRGINPQAPYVLGATRRNNPKSVYWVLENGVRMSGMPDFARTLSEAQIWQLTAFLHADRGITVDAYRLATAPP